MQNWCLVWPCCRVSSVLLPHRDHWLSGILHCRALRRWLSSGVTAAPQHQCWLPCKAERQLLGSQVLVQSGILGYWHLKWDKAVKRLSQHCEFHQMHHICHLQLPNSMKSSDLPSKSPFLLQNRGTGQGTSYSLHLLCSIIQTWEHKPSWHHRDLLVGLHIRLSHIPKEASTSGDHILIFQIGCRDRLWTAQNLPKLVTRFTYTCSRVDGNIPTPTPSSPRHPRKGWGWAQAAYAMGGAGP